MSNNDLFTLDIFERAVQDPCCDGCDHEDERCYSECADEEEEFDPLEEAEAHKNKTLGDIGVPCKKHNGLVRHKSTPTVPAHRPARKRANSATLIRHVSRQSTLDSITPVGMSIEEGQRKDFSQDQYQLQEQEQQQQREQQQEQLQQQQQPVQRTRSSCACIPTHLYGLEKYVSSALDALSTGEYDEVQSPVSTVHSSIVSSPFSSQASSISNTHNDSRKKSFIEISLSKSFSQ